MVISKKERFKKIAVNRTNRILDTLRLLGNCANTLNYEYSDEDAKKIFQAIENELKKSKSKFFDENEPKKFRL